MECSTAKMPWELFSYLTLGFHDVYDFSKLPIPFLCIATDLTNGEEVVLDKRLSSQSHAGQHVYPGSIFIGRNQWPDAGGWRNRQQLSG